MTICFELHNHDAAQDRFAVAQAADPAQDGVELSLSSSNRLDVLPQYTGGSMKDVAPPGDAAQRKLVRNEQLKLTAAYLNTVAGGLTTAGAIVPGLAYLYDTNPPHAQLWGLLLLGCLGGGVCLHLAARKALKGMVA